MKNIRVLGLIIVLMLPLALWAQDASLKVSTKRQVVVGEQFRVAFEANADGKKFSAPSFEGFTVVGGPFNSSSSSVQIVNGSMSRTISNTYSYVIRAEKEGTFTIGSASYIVDGEEVKSEPVQVVVVAGEANANASASTQGGSSGTQALPSNTNDPQVSGFEAVRLRRRARGAYL